MDATTETVLLQGVGQVAVRAVDVERAADFYRDVLGMTPLLRLPEAAFFDCGGVRLMVGRAESPEFDHPCSILYYRVADVEAAHRQLSERGVQFRGDPHPVARLQDHELWLAFFLDSEGNTLALMEERRL